MDLMPTPAQEAFRERLRAWLSDHPIGPEPRDDPERFAFRLAWQHALHADGWAGVRWPVEFGGQGVTAVEQAIFEEELARHGAPEPANIAGLFLVAPMVMTFGTTEQQERILPTILSGDEIWCEGYSEPGAGSDLGALQTRAVRDGDEWVVTGQKVWTSHAQHAKWCLLLARTDAAAPKLKGLTCFQMDMDQPGVEVRPLRQITGISEFNEVFLDGARIPHENVIGGEGRGWAMIMSALAYGRANIGIAMSCWLHADLRELRELAAAHGLHEDPAIRDRIADLYTEIEALRLTAWRGIARARSDGRATRESALSKWHWSQISQDLSELAMDIRGPSGAVVDDRWADRFLHSRSDSIMAGTTEIQKTMVAEQILGLPKSR